MIEIIGKIWIQRDSYFCFVIFSVPFAHFICEIICVTPFMDQVSIYE